MIRNKPSQRKEWQTKKEKKSYPQSKRDKLKDHLQLNH